MDRNPWLNMASFVTTWMESECDKFITAAINKNHVDMDEYPFTTKLQTSGMARLSPTSAQAKGETAMRVRLQRRTRKPVFQASTASERS
ncbi:hypothetical protein Ahy_A10g047687 [Arachis hypogaea]|uniref:Glutamate decarboxylase n=1 Tax=Arachis hypogaea TaxID=3818 RepID=A0A445B349_ARAHY|nr:hypothetical protein Ahy_A10g047687 [Arachis hypogaea]